MTVSFYDIFPSIQSHAIFEHNLFLDTQFAATFDLLPSVIGYSYVDIPVQDQVQKNGPKRKRTSKKRRASQQESRKGLVIISPVSHVIPL